MAGESGKAPREHAPGLLRLWRVAARPGRRAELLRMLPGSDLRHPVPGRDAVIWAADPEDENALLVVEYWGDTYELGGGAEAEGMANFTLDAKHLIAERAEILEAAPVWVHGLPQPFGWRRYTEEDEKAD